MLYERFAQHRHQERDEDLAGEALSAGRELGRSGCEFFAIFGKRDQSRALLVRRRGCEAGDPHSAARANPSNLACLFTGSAAGAVLWLSGAWPLRTAAGSAFQSGKA